MALIRWEPIRRSEPARRWEPVRELDSLQQEFSRVFGSFFDSLAGRPVNGAALRRWVPATDLVEHDDQYVLRSDLPGVNDGDVKVELEDNVLTISGQRRSEHEQRKDGYRRVERSFGSFSRSLTLPEGVDPEQIHASFERGVLEVTIPKPEQRKPHRVAIAVGEGDSAIEGAAAGEHGETDAGVEAPEAAKAA
jgi:HSP20 family protein